MVNDGSQMQDSEIGAQYSTGLSRHNIEQALIAAGKNLGHLQPADLAPLDYPLPWADRPERSHLATPDELHAAVEAAGFAVEHWNDLTDQAAELMEAFLSLPPSPLGLHAFVERFTEKAGNLTRGLSGGRVRVIQGIARAIA